MNYCLARYADEQKRKAYNVYVTDALKVISENTAKFAGFAGGGYMNVRFIDIIEPKPEETRTPDEIINHIKDKLRA